MTQIPSQVPVPRGTIRVPILGQPTGGASGILAGAAGAAEQIGGAVANIGLQLLKAERERAITDLETTGLGLIADAETAADEADPALAEAAYDDALSRHIAQIQGIENANFKADALSRFNRLKELGSIRVRRRARGREAAAGQVAVDAFGDELITGKAGIAAGGMTAEEATARFSERANAFIGTIFTDAAASARAIDTFRKRAVAEEYNYWLNQTPEMAIALMDADIAIEAMTDDERRRRVSVAERALKVEEVNEAKDAFEAAQIQIDGLLLDDELATTDLVGEAVEDLSRALASLPGVDISADEYAMDLLTPHLKRAAEEGNADLFDTVAGSMPQTGEAQLQVEQQRNTLERRMAENARIINADDEVKRALAHSPPLSLPNTAEMRAAINRDASQFVNDRINSPNPPESPDALTAEIIARYGPLGQFPTLITDEVAATIRNIEAATPDQIADATGFLTFSRTQAPSAYANLPTDLRKFNEVYETTSQVGRTPAEVAVRVIAKLHPENMAAAEELARRKPEHDRFSESKLVELISSDFDIDVEAESVFRNIFGSDEEAPRLAVEQLGDTIPFALVTLYNNEVHDNLLIGMNIETSVTAAWVRVKEEFGVTEVFRDRKVITDLPMEQFYTQGTDNIETDLANRMAIDWQLQRLVFPDSAPEFPKISGFTFESDEDGRPIRASQKVRSARQAKEAKRYLRDNLQFVPMPHDLPQADGSGLPLYQPVFIDARGAVHPIMRRVFVTNEAGERMETQEPYLIAPIQGITSFEQIRENEKQNVEAVRGAERRVRRRARGAAKAAEHRAAWAQYRRRKKEIERVREEAEERVRRGLPPPGPNG